MSEPKSRKPLDSDKKTIEVELRLAGDADVLETIFTSSLGPQIDGPEGTTADLENRYFDTADRALHAKGLALRVRTNGAECKQTLKAGDNAKAALLKRTEWEITLDNDQLKLDAFPKEARELLPKSARTGDLQQALTTRIKRRLRNVTCDDQGERLSQIEAVLDLGEIEAGNSTMPVAEIELELQKGTPGDLYRLALDLQDVAPFHLETRSKSARAFDLLAKKPPSWHRSKRLMISRSDSIDDAMEAIFANCFEHWLANQAAAFDGQDPEGVHQMRVALRRLRSALSIFRKLIPSCQMVWLQAGAKAALGGLGPARDWDVFQSELLAPLVAARPYDRDLGVLAARAKSRGHASYRSARKMLKGADYTRFTLRFGRWLEERAWRQESDAGQATLRAKPITDFARKLLDKRNERALAKGHHLTDLTTEQRHELRITLKKLRYAIEFFKPLFEKKAMKPFLNQLKALQDDFGHLNDVAVAETLLNDLLARRSKQDIRRAAGLVIGWHARGVEANEPALLRDWDDFTRQRGFFWD